MASRKTRTGGKAGSHYSRTGSLKLRIRGKDGGPLTMRELREGLMEAARALAPYEAEYRAKSASLYLTMIDEDGRPVRLNEANELTIDAYRTAAEELGL